MDRVTRNGHHTRTSTYSLEERAVHVESTAHREHGSHAGHDKHVGHSVAMLRDKFWLSFVLTVPTLIWGDDADCTGDQRSI